ncbi:MAG: DUF6989 domain-containing protein [Candidatus Thorarchaeota archaeon SMTZ1-45]|nr:MAG: hypothetical protein AM325_14630 [Candidatus Thorarchaeota archaeon SMTZ1-45]
MQILRDKSVREFFVTHIIFAILTAMTLLIPVTAPISAKLLIVVIIYNGLVMLQGLRIGFEEWMSIWTFSFILSLLMVFPDWYLSETLGALQFPVDGFPMIGGAIPIYMAGLWTMPFFIIVFTGVQVQQRKSGKLAFIVVSILTVLIFVLAELTLVYLPSWSATVSGMTGNLAWYIIIPELFLGLSTFISYKIIKDKKIWMKLAGAFAVMIFYIGNTSFFFFLIETLLLGA